MYFQSLNKSLQCVSMLYFLKHFDINAITKKKNAFLIIKIYYFWSYKNCLNFLSTKSRIAKLLQVYI